MAEDREFTDLLLSYAEWNTFECKRAMVQPSRLLETVIAFANASGGTIVLGLEDPAKASGRRRIIGISESRENLSEYLKQIDKEVDPPVRGLNIFELEVINAIGNADQLLLVRIAKSDEVHSLKRGDTYLRKGHQNVKLTAREIARLQYEKGAVKFESEFSDVGTLDVLDGELLKTYKRDNGSETQDDWQFLKDHGLAIQRGNEMRLTQGGVLLFSRNPAVAVGRKCGIKISHYYGTRRTFTGDPNFVRRPFSIEGPLLFQIQKSLDYFRQVVRESPPKLRGSAFHGTFLVPEWAFQEAVTNAVIHRNYSYENDIQIRFFEDRVEIESPGTYPGQITVRNIRAERYARNPLIQRTLNRFQSAPNLDIGEGVDRMFQVMREEGLYEPLYLPPTDSPNAVILVLFNLKRIENWDTVSRYLHDHYRVTNAEARRITGIRDTLRMSRLLKMWVSKGLLAKADGASKKGTYYVLPGQGPGLDLFSRPLENKQNK